MIIYLLANFLLLIYQSNSIELNYNKTKCEKGIDTFNIGKTYSADFFGVCHICTCKNDEIY